jgi:hypothetical protein
MALGTAKAINNVNTNSLQVCFSLLTILKKEGVREPMAFKDKFGREHYVTALPQCSKKIPAMLKEKRRHHLL